MSQVNNEPVDESVLNEFNSIPRGPKPRHPLSSYLERSVYNFTMPHKNITVRQKMPPSDNESAEEIINSDDDSIYMSLHNESPIFKRIQTSTPQSSSRATNFKGCESISYLKHTRTVRYSETLERTPSPFNGTKKQQSKSSSPVKKPSSPVKNTTRTSNSRSFLIWIVLISCIVLIASVCFYHRNNVAKNIIAEEVPQDPEASIRKLENSIGHLKKEFHNQDLNIWYEITSAVRDVILNPNKPSMIILFANESNTMNCLARSIAVVTSNVLNGNNYLTLTPNNMGSNLGHIVHTLKPRVEEIPVVIVQDFLNIHPEAIKGFHNLCDRENPLVKKAVYVITMLVNGYKKSENPLSFIENQITRKLSASIDPDILMALAIRITEGPAIEVQAQQDLANCLSI